MTKNLKNAFAFIVGLLFAFLMLKMILTPVAAHGASHDDINITILHEYEAPPEGGGNTGTNDGFDNGASIQPYSKLFAMLNAPNFCVFDYARGWQGCGSVGWYDNYYGYNAMFATRIDNTMIKFGIQFDEDFDEYSGGVGASMHFN